MNVTGSVFRLATADVNPVGPVNLGILHVGQSASTPLTVTNSAANDGFSERLSGSISGQTGAATGTGSFTRILPGAGSTALSFSINTLTAGAKVGHV